VALVVCKSCKRAFISGLENEEVCPECKDRVSKLYPAVRNLLRNNDRKLYTAREVSKILGVDLKDVEILVSLGLIESAVKTAGGGKSASMHAYDRKKKDKRARGSK
jgi:hypothetical protein